MIEHLEAKVEDKNFKSHPLIDEFIPTIEGEDGICYTHPEKLPGKYAKICYDNCVILYNFYTSNHDKQEYQTFVYYQSTNYKIFKSRKSKNIKFLCVIKSINYKITIKIIR